MDEIFVTLSSVFSYLNSTPDSRCIVEGEQLLNAKHIILIGTTDVRESYADVFALCLQTSAIKSGPHEIKGKLFIEEQKARISKFVCSCKAGLSGSCKHIAAVLLKCTRSSISALEKLSSTDLKCYWSNKKKEIIEDYEAQPILQTSCFNFKVRKTQQPTLAQEQEFFNTLLSVCPESSLYCHLKGRCTSADQEICQETQIQGIAPVLKSLVANASHNEFLLSIDINSDSYQIKSCCKNVMQKYVNLKAFEKALMCTQKSDTWYQERMYRITGSRCYSLYTYSKDDWDAKASSYFWPKQINNKFIEHGLKYEKKALKRYEESNGYDIVHMGLVICKQHPWLAYSPDGVVMTNGVPTRLVEIKCPYDGINEDAINFINSCSYLEVSSEQGVTLKRKHKYYGQIQLGMAILNLKICDLILYYSKSQSFLNILVPFDEEFTRSMICNVTDKYFNFMLHLICKKHKMVKL